MDENVLLRIGRVIKTHGVSGDILIAPDSEDVARLTDLSEYRIGHSASSTSLFEVTGAKPHHVKKHIGVVARLEGITSIGEAQSLIGFGVYAREEDLPPLEDDRVFLDDLPGYLVVDHGGNEIGLVSRWDDYPSQIMLTIQRTDSTLLIPFVVPEIVSEVNTDSRRLVLADWEGLADD